MTENRTGSNQYKRVAKQNDSVAPLLMIPATSTDRIRMRCGEVWGSKCQTWVEAPEYRHGAHPSGKAREDKARDPDTPAEILATLALDEDKAVCQAARNNPHLPNHIRAMIALAE